ncbi:Hpt domain-containing protein [Maridesulfovibrio hydrothermalis]|uniref:Hpt protein n=1 Tax=Maridesulfovibrio hydrothermalis AM13 = DSM 14728 TaxID=1121451 RepID=L0RA78_9BACT|nr:Hpt domain-containing protein [Maridesulfovibrio hydrothermalis]CCO23688.1 Hpt protein [Maridesulfovibrio hydrothermalis AM13 = DSM 14728]
MTSGEKTGHSLFIINEDLKELIPHFVVHQFDELHQMESSLEAGNLEEVGRLGHSLKGAAANFCLDPLCRLGATIHDVSKLGMTDALGPLVQKYRTYLTELKVQVS